MNTRILACLFVLCAAATACSGGEPASTRNSESPPTASVGGSPGGSATQPSSGPGGTSTTNAKARFIARADRICTDFHREEAALESRFNSGKESQPGYYRGIARLLRDALRDLRSLDPPTSDRRFVDRYLELIAQSASTFDALARANEQGDHEEEQRLARRARDIGEQTRAMARSYGFKECGS